MITPALRHRIPLLDGSGALLLRRLEEHPHAPRWTHEGFDRVSPAGVARAREYAAEIAHAPPRWSHGAPPAWVEGFVRECLREVPVYRRLGAPPARFDDLPTFDRGDLNREPWSFVPDRLPLDDLIVYNTSGTTGHPLDILTHPDALALYVPLLRAALAAHGVTLEGGPGRVAIVQVCCQRQTYTYAAATPLLEQGGFVKVNLDPARWREPGDPARFLDDLRAEVASGDPVSFAALAALPLRWRPAALVSTAMALHEGLRASLAARFSCPVVDLYSLNESGPVAVAQGGMHRLLQPRLYVEVLDGDGVACAPGVRGEVTLTGGFNPFLPLLRYRTGDHAALVFDGGTPALDGLEGRAPSSYRAGDGSTVHGIDVSNALRHLPIVRYRLRQRDDGSLLLDLDAPGVPHEAVREGLLGLFGPAQPLEIGVPGTEGKLLHEAGGLAGAAGEAAT